MNYKKIIKSRALRLRILRCLNWIPDKTMLKIQYRIKTGRKLNLKKPQRYTEKIITIARSNANDFFKCFISIFLLNA